MALDLKNHSSTTVVSPLVSFYEPVVSTSTQSQNPNQPHDPSQDQHQNQNQNQNQTQTQTPSPSPGRVPKLVLIASWMDARDLHITKYIARYQTLYPSARILLVKSVLKHFIFESQAVKAVQPAVAYLKSLVASGYLSVDPTQPEILLHVFSNGGMGTTRHLFEAYQRVLAQPFPLHAAVYDSAPGYWSYWGVYNASMTGIRRGQWYLRWLAGPALHILSLYFMFVVVVLRRPYHLLINGKFHNNRTSLRQASRAYIYGKKDTMVAWRHVEQHAQEAADRGYAVRCEAFKDSPHVAHMRSDENRYWKIVTETWEQANEAV